MLYLIADYFHFEGLSNLIRYQSFRAGATMLTALVLGLIIGPRFIDMLRVRQGNGQPRTAPSRTSPSAARRRWAG